MASAMTPIASVARSISLGWVSASKALVRATPPEALTPSRSGIWLRTMFTPIPVRKPSITE